MPTGNQSMGDLLRQLRQRCGMSRQQLAERAGVSARTVAYWEAQEHVPRLPELDAVLQVLKLSASERAQVLALLTTPSGIRLAHLERMNETPLLPNALSDPLPDLGDLMRAMRLRRGWSQERLAAAVGASRQSVNQWETTRKFPTQESLLRVCQILNAHPDELAALTTRRLLPPQWTPQITLEDCWRQAEPLQSLMRQGWSPWIDLSLLVLTRQLRLLASTSAEALTLLAHLTASYAHWLIGQERNVEAATTLQRAFSAATATRQPYLFTPTLLNLQSYLIGSRPGGRQRIVAALSAGIEQIPEMLRPTLYCDLAYYTARLADADGAEHWLGQARHALEKVRHEQANGNRYYRVTLARTLLQRGKPVEALEWMPLLPPGPDHPNRTFSLRLWSEALLAAGEIGAAQQHLNRLGALLTAHERPLDRRHWEILTRKL